MFGVKFRPVLPYYLHEPYFKQTITLFGSWRNVCLIDVLDAKLEEFQAIQCVERVLLWDLLQGGEYPSVGLTPVLVEEVPFFQLEKQASNTLRLELRYLTEQHLCSPFQMVPKLIKVKLQDLRVIF